MNIKNVLKNGESESVEFKKSLSLKEKGCRALCGMINTDEGTGMVVFGISDEKEIIGIEPGNLDTVQKTLCQYIRQKFEPSLNCSIETLEYNGKNILTISANRMESVAYYEFDGRAYIREGTTTRQLSYDEKQLFKEKRNPQKVTSKELVKNREFDFLKDVIKVTMEDFEKFIFNTTYDPKSNSQMRIAKKITGKDAVRKFFEYIKKILENNIRSSAGFNKGFLINLFPDGILNNIKDLKFLLKTIINTIELIRNSNSYKEQNIQLSHIFNKFVRFLNENLIYYKALLLEIEDDLLPKVIEICQNRNRTPTELPKFNNGVKEIKDALDVITKLVEI